MTHTIYQRLLTHRAKRKIQGNKLFTMFLVYCSAGCPFPIMPGDRVVSKYRKRSRRSVFHKKCLEAAYYEL